MSYELALIGAGNMAEAIARGLLNGQSLSPEQIIAADPAENRRTLFTRELGIRTTAKASEAAKDALAVLLAVKPQQMDEVLHEISSVISEKTLVISIAAGISTRFIETHLGLGRQWRVVRTMPNTPMLVGQGAVGVCSGAFATRADVTAASRFFSPAAEVVEVTEQLMDAVTAVSGSGPAYVFYLLEHMIAAGVSLGLSPDQATQLARQTVLGAATMATTTSDSPTELRRKVTSPNGTTQAAIEYLDQTGVGSHLEKAIQAAYQRSVELGKK
ncbi:MAG: pyrroline-5-carboxylate reductase [Phycisphaerae bacterium]|jgi:pyrroline-5-carboxylate reductase|nr:MAG: pyrroline-5-carboxylate reductase [Phycisphaerae bacterium]